MRRLWSVLLCVCLALTGCAGAGRQGGGEAQPERTNGSSYELLPIAPVREETHERYVQDARDLLASSQDSLARMNEAASEKGARAEQLARAAREKCEQRLEELAASDLSAMSDDALKGLLLEISGIITTLREARDAIADLS